MNSRSDKKTLFIRLEKKVDLISSVHFFFTNDEKNIIIEWLYWSYELHTKCSRCDVCRIIIIIDRHFVR